MLRFRMNKGVLFAFIFPFNAYNSFDKNYVKNKDDSGSTDYINETSGIERLKHMFFKSDGVLTKEVSSIISGTTFCAVGAFVVGGMLNAARYPEKFKKENQTTAFLSPMDAQKRLNDKLMLEFFRKGLSYSWRIGLFTFLNQAIGVALYTYRGKHEIKNYSMAGAIAGCVYKIRLGLHGLVAGGIIGGIFGTVYGCLSIGMLYITGINIEDVYDSHFERLERNRRAKNVIDSETKEIIQDYNESVLFKQALLNVNNKPADNL